MKETRMPAAVRCATLLLVVLALPGICAARGLGIKAGEGRLHPAIDLDLVYDSNAGYFTDDPVGDLILRIRPGVTLSFPSEKVSFELSGKVGYDYYTGIDQSRTTDLSTVAGEADMRLGFNPAGQISFFIEDTFTRSGDPRYTSLSGKFDRTDNEAKANLQIKPGGGALMFDLAYGFFIDLFDETVESQGLSSYGHRIYFSGKWKFLPKTAVTLDFDSDLRRYPDEFQAGQTYPDVNAIRATIGLLGQITPNMSVVVKAGYGDSLMGSDYTGDDYRSAIGQAEITYKAGTTFIQAGYTRNFQPVVMFGYFGHDKVYARYRQQIAGKFTLAADVGFDWLSYGDAVMGDVAAQGDRSDGLVDGKLSLDYHIQDWIEVGLAYNIQSRFAPDDWRQPEGNASVEYTKHMFTLHIGVDY
jgi:hypothetical protein